MAYDRTYASTISIDTYYYSINFYATMCYTVNFSHEYLYIISLEVNLTIRKIYSMYQQSKSMIPIINFAKYK